MSIETFPNVTPDTLNSVMEFDRVIQVHEGGRVTTAPDNLQAPEMNDGELSQLPGGGWSLMSGYTGQHGYNGPSMHQSEFIGGRMARDILETPGYYVALVDYPGSCDGEYCDMPDGCVCEPESWGVARLDAPEGADAVLVRDEWHYGNSRGSRVVTMGSLRERLQAEAEHATDEPTRAGRRANIAAALDELQKTGTSASWSWHTFTVLAPATEGA